VPDAAAVDTCWRSAKPLRMLCLVDPWGRTLDAADVQIAVAAVPNRSAPVPLGLQLADGTRCRLRDGGAWGNPQAEPTYEGYYYCAGETFVWAPKDSYPGIDRSFSRWTVLVGGAAGPLRTVGVDAAYYVTTAS
jgi:hypothetical protein